MLMTDITGALNLDKVSRQLELTNTMAANVQHDIKAPLDAIGRLVKMLISIKSADEKVTSLLKTIQTSSKMLLWQANNFFDNNLIFTRNFYPHISEFEIENVLSEVIDIV